MRAASPRWPVVAMVAALALQVARAGSFDAPEVTDAMRDEATEPGGVPMCPAQTCPPAFSSYPGDILRAWIGPETDTYVTMDLEVNGSSTTGSSSSLLWTWSLHWTLAGTAGTASATMLPTGVLQCGDLAAVCSVNASRDPSARDLEMLVLRSALGSPAAGAVMKDVWAEAHGRPQAKSDAPGGAADRAPDSGFGSDYVLTWSPPAPPTTNATAAVASSSTPPAKAAPMAAWVALGAVGLAAWRRRH